MKKLQILKSAAVKTIILVIVAISQGVLHDSELVQLKVAFEDNGQGRATHSNYIGNFNFFSQEVSKQDPAARPTEDEADAKRPADGWKGLD